MSLANLMDGVRRVVISYSVAGVASDDVSTVPTPTETVTTGSGSKSRSLLYYIVAHFGEGLLTCDSQEHPYRRPFDIDVTFCIILAWL